MFATMQKSLEELNHKSEQKMFVLQMKVEDWLKEVEDWKKKTIALETKVEDGQKVSPARLPSSTSPIHCQWTGLEEDNRAGDKAKG